MNFRPRRAEEPEINLIPFIDILLVVLIFLVLTTTYAKHTEIQLTLPVADTENQKEYPKELIVTVNAEGNYSINRVSVVGRSVETIADALLQGAQGNRDTVIIIHADASAKHQSVITVMEAARRAGLGQITFATQSTAQAAGP